MYLLIGFIIAFLSSFFANNGSVLYCCECAKGFLREEWAHYVRVWGFWGSRLYRKQVNRRRSSKRAMQLLDKLDEVDLDVLLDQEIVDGPVRLAFKLSRAARMQLHYPKHSPANERIVSDWIQKNWPTDTRTSVKASTLPLAIKLSFVRSRSEDEASNIFGMLSGAVDVA